MKPFRTAITVYLCACFANICKQSATINTKFLKNHRVWWRQEACVCVTIYGHKLFVKDLPTGLNPCLSVRTAAHHIEMMEMKTVK